MERGREARKRLEELEAAEREKREVEGGGQEGAAATREATEGEDSEEEQYNSMIAGLSEVVGDLLVMGLP